MIHRQRMTATLDGDFVVFLIGMRFNNLFAVHKWWPVFIAMPGMIKELEQHPEMGFMHADLWLGRTTILRQYWRSMDHLLA